MCVLLHISGNEQLSSSVSLHITVLDINDNMPTLSQDYQPYVCEDTQAGEVNHTQRLSFLHMRIACSFCSPPLVTMPVYFCEVKKSQKDQQLILACSMLDCIGALKTYNTHTHTHTHTHTCWFLWFTGTFHRRNGFYTVQTVCAIALHLPYT